MGWTILYLLAGIGENVRLCKRAGMQLIWDISELNFDQEANDRFERKTG